MKSRLYEGQVRHRRVQPKAHEFSYRVFMPYLCLDELPELFDNNWLWSARGRALAQFRRSDFLGDPQVPLQQEVRRRIFEETGKTHSGPIYLLANLRYFGYSMNPIACYYCFNEDESRLEYLVGDTVRFSKTGAGILAGLGYDIRVARNISITPSVTYYYGTTGTATVDDIAVPGTNHDVLDFELGVTFH